MWAEHQLPCVIALLCFREVKAGEPVLVLSLCPSTLLARGGGVVLWGPPEARGSWSRRGGGFLNRSLAASTATLSVPVPAASSFSDVSVGDMQR